MRFSKSEEDDIRAIVRDEIRRDFRETWAKANPNYSDRDSLLGDEPIREFKIYRTAWPAIFRFDGRLFQEQHDKDLWIEISPEYAEWWFNGREEAE